MKILIIQQNGQHNKNRYLRECFCWQRAFESHGHETLVWGLDHRNFKDIPNFNQFDLIFNLENYTTNWLPDLSSVRAKKIWYAVDSHVLGHQHYVNMAENHNYDILAVATRRYTHTPTKIHQIWLPNSVDHTQIKSNPEISKTYEIGFCGNKVTQERRIFIEWLVQNRSMKFDEMAIGQDMIDAICSYRIHWNMNISFDVNYRNFETMALGTCLLTNFNEQYKDLGFVHGDNCLIYISAMHCNDLVQSTSNETAAKIGENGKRFVLDHHTTYIRCGQLLTILK